MALVRKSIKIAASTAVCTAAEFSDEFHSGSFKILRLSR